MTESANSAIKAEIDDNDRELKFTKLSLCEEEDDTETDESLKDLPEIDNLIEEEVPLEYTEEEQDGILSEESSLDGDETEISEALNDADESDLSEEESDENAEEILSEYDPDEQALSEMDSLDGEVDENETLAESGENLENETSAEKAEVVKPEKSDFKLTAPANLEEIFANIAVKRGRKLIYKPEEILVEHTARVIGTDKNNDEGIKIKNILDAEIKQGVKLGYLDKFDGLSGSELKDEYENDTVYEFAEQELKRTGVIIDGKRCKVYIYDWDMKSCHHIGYFDEETTALIKPYVEAKDRYSFDFSSIIVGGKYKKIIKDDKTGKIKIEKGNDGTLGLETDIVIVNRKD